MDLAFWLFPFSFALTLLSMPLLILAAPRLRLMDNPGGRKQHQRVTPLVGGLAIAMGLLPVVACLHVQTLQPLLWLIGMLMMLALGILDDRAELKVTDRFVLHIMIGLLLFGADRELISLGDLFGVGPVLLGWLALPVTLFSVAAAINSMNMVDGVDGLLGTLSAIPLGAVMFISWEAGLVFEFALSGCLLISVLVFLLFNFRFPWTKHARVFMGDAGSTLIGFSLAWLLISEARLGAMPPVLALFLLALPLMDTAGVICRRYMAGVSASTAGRDHLHHILLDAGLSEAMTVITLGAASLLITILGLFLHYHGVGDQYLFLCFMFMLGVYIGMSTSASTVASRLSRYFSNDEASAPSLYENR